MATRTLVPFAVLLSFGCGRTQLYQPLQMPPAITAPAASFTGPCPTAPPSTPVQLDHSPSGEPRWVHVGTWLDGVAELYSTSDSSSTQWFVQRFDADGQPKGDAIWVRGEHGNLWPGSVFAHDEPNGSLLLAWISQGTLVVAEVDASGGFSTLATGPAHGADDIELVRLGSAVLLAIFDGDGLYTRVVQPDGTLTVSNLVENRASLPAGTDWRSPVTIAPISDQEAWLAHSERAGEPTTIHRFDSNGELLDGPIKPGGTVMTMVRCLGTNEVGVTMDVDPVDQWQNDTHREQFGRLSQSGAWTTHELRSIANPYGVSASRALIACSQQRSAEAWPAPGSALTGTDNGDDLDFTAVGASTHFSLQSITHPEPHSYVDLQGAAMADCSATFTWEVDLGNDAEARLMMLRAPLE